MVRISYYGSTLGPAYPFQDQNSTLASCVKIRVYDCVCVVVKKNWQVYLKLLDAFVSFHNVLFVCDYFLNTIGEISSAEE